MSAPIHLDAAGDACAGPGPIARPKLWLLQPRMQPESVCRPIIERLAHAIDDLESLKAI